MTRMTEPSSGTKRSVTLARGSRSARIEEWVENLTDFDRPINWMEHATFGPPFIQPGKTALDVSATNGQVAGGRPGAKAWATLPAAKA